MSRTIKGVRARAHLPRSHRQIRASFCFAGIGQVKQSVGQTEPLRDLGRAKLCRGVGLLPDNRNDAACDRPCRSWRADLIRNNAQLGSLFGEAQDGVFRKLTPDEENTHDVRTMT